MTSKKIAETLYIGGLPEPWLKEIAYQLAVLNEQLKSGVYTEDSRYLLGVIDTIRCDRNRLRAGLAESSTAPATSTNPSEFLMKLKELERYLNTLEDLDDHELSMRGGTILGLAVATVEHLLKLADPEVGKGDAQPGAGSAE